MDVLTFKMALLVSFPRKTNRAIISVTTRELKFYYKKWPDVIVVRKWLIWAHSPTGLEFYWEKILRGLATHVHHVEHSLISIYLFSSCILSSSLISALS